jgi:hypothetical protein
LVSVTTAAFTGWLVKAAYDHGNFRVPAILLGASVILQVGLTLASSDEEKTIASLEAEVELLRHEKEIWYRVEISKLERKLAIADRQITEIKKGNMSGVREWAEVEKLL